MIRMCAGTNPPLYKSGKWSWDNKLDKLHFEPHKDLEDIKERYIDTNGFRFLRTINPSEEAVYREDYMRSESEFDNDIISINDVRDLVLFLMPKKFLTMMFLEFMHKPAVHRLLHALIIYFEYFLRLVEFVLIRRDELAGDMAQIQSEQTNEMKRLFSIYLSQYRLLVARNYSVILKGEGDMAEFYHMKSASRISDTLKDRAFHEQFLAVSIHIVYITMHRRAYDVIEMEMNRLFRSEHFMIHRPEYLKFTPAERSLLYGRKNKMVNSCVQLSPLILELQHMAEEDLPILWIGERKYCGNNIRIAKIELEYIVPDTQLHLIDVTHGILGHPKRFYNTILTLDWRALRDENYSLTHDPYRIIRQPNLRISNVIDRQKMEMSQNCEQFLRIFPIYEPCPRKIIRKWLQREKILLSCEKGELKHNIFVRCNRELGRPSVGSNASSIIASYFRLTSRLRKEISYIGEDKFSATRGSIVSLKPQRTNDDHFFVE